MKKEKILKFLNFGSTLFLIAVGAVLLWFGARAFVYDVFPVSTMSMYPTITPGDRIFVDKLVFGARIYKNMDFIRGDSLETFRVPGFRGIRRNDVVVFNFPCGNDDWRKIEFRINRVFAKRCVALPGDTISVVDGYYRNSSTADTVGYRSAQERFSEVPDGEIPREIIGAFPFDSSRYTWTVKNFGPLYVPRKGDEVALDTVNFVLFRLPVEHETGRTLSVCDGRLCLGGTPISRYHFRENYYFMGGDNVSNSQDSRYFGFVPEEFVVGVVTRILYSRDKETGRFRWNRLLKHI